MWLGRNEDGTLVVSLIRLEREYSTWGHKGYWASWNGDGHNIARKIADIPEFDYLTWADDPVEVTLTKLK